MGFRQFSHHYTEIQLALRLGDLERARKVLGEWQERSTFGLGSEEISRPSIEGALAAVIGMLKPMNLGNGLIFDGRSVMISLASLFFGPLAAAISVLPPLALRVYLGGDGMLMGVSVILMSSAVGLAFGRKSRAESRPPESLSLYAFGLIVHVFMVLLLFLLPRERVMPTLRTLGPSILVLYPLATVLAGKILSYALNNQRRIVELKTNERHYRDTLDFIPIPVGIVDSSGRVRYVNRRFTETFGYRLEDIPQIGDWKRKAYPDAEYRGKAEALWNADVVAAKEGDGSTPNRLYLVARS